MPGFAGNKQGSNICPGLFVSANSRDFSMGDLVDAAHPWVASALADKRLIFDSVNYLLHRVRQIKDLRFSFIIPSAN